MCMEYATAAVEEQQQKEIKEQQQKESKPTTRKPNCFWKRKSSTCEARKESLPNPVGRTFAFVSPADESLSRHREEKVKHQSMRKASSNHVKANREPYHNSTRSSSRQYSTSNPSSKRFFAKASGYFTDSTHSSGTKTCSSQLV